MAYTDKISPAQRRFILDLLDDKVEAAGDDIIVKMMRISEDPEEFGCNRRDASRIIDELKARPRRKAVEHDTALPADDADPEATDDRITTPGIFEHDGIAYVVKPNRAKTRLYAKRLVPSTERLNDAGDPVDFDFEYAPGAMAFLREHHRMDVERGKALTIRYGRCICCGRRLKVRTSVERGIGPVCIKYFASAPGYGQHTDLDDSTPVRDEADSPTLDDMEYARGYYDTQNAQAAGPPGSAAREAAFMDMEAQWAREGFDG